MELYDSLEREGKLTARATLAQFYDPEEIRTADGKVDFDRWWRAPRRCAPNTPPTR